MVITDIVWDIDEEEVTNEMTAEEMEHYGFMLKMGDITVNEIVGLPETVTLPSEISDNFDEVNAYLNKKYGYGIRGYKRREICENEELDNAEAEICA